MNCWSLDFVDGLPQNFLRQEELPLTLAEDRAFFLSEWKEPGQMNYGDLRDYIRGVEEMGSDTTDFRVALNFKLSFPLVSLIMVLIGIPFAFSMGTVSPIRVP